MNKQQRKALKRLTKLAWCIRCTNECIGHGHNARNMGRGVSDDHFKPMHVRLGVLSYQVKVCAFVHNISSELLAQVMSYSEGIS